MNLANRQLLTLYGDFSQWIICKKYSFNINKLVLVSLHTTHTYVLLSTYCISLIYVHRAGDWGQALVAFRRLRRHGRGHAVCKTKCKVFTSHCSTSLHRPHMVGRSVGEEVSNLFLRRRQRDYHHHVTVDSTDHTHKHQRPEKDVKVHPVRVKLGLVNQSDYRRKNLFGRTSCRAPTLLHRARRCWRKEEECMEENTVVGEEARDVQQALGSGFLEFIQQSRSSSWFA